MTNPCPEQRRHRRAGRPWVVLGLFGLLALGLMWPVPAYLTSRVPGTATWAFDEYTFVWNNWYLRHALLDLHASPLHTDLIWFPLGIDLILYTFNFTNALLALPLQLAFNLPLASNVTLLLATMLSGFGAYLLTLHVLQDHVRPPRGRAVPEGTRWWSLPGRAPAGLASPLRLAALLAGIVYAAGTNRAVYAALGHYNFATSQWLPFYMLYLLRALRRPHVPEQAFGPAAAWRDALLAGLFLALAALTEMTYAAFLALLTLVVLMAQFGALRRRWKGRGGLAALAGRLAVIGLAAGLIWSPVLVPIAREFVSGDYGSEGWGESITLSADLAGLITPSNLNPVLGPEPAAPLTAGLADGQRPNWQAELRAVEEGKGRFRDINTVFLGYATLALAMLGALMPSTRRGARPWSWAAVVFGLLSLGPLLQIGGRFRFSLDRLLPEGVTFPLPFALLHYVPVLSANRAPNRYSLILMLALAVLAALGGWGIMSRLPRATGLGNPIHPRWAPLAATVLAAAVLLEHLAVPLPTTNAQVPEVYRKIAGEPGQFSILQLPLGWRNSYETFGSESTQLQYYQAFHGKPIIGGNISRAPVFKMDYFRRIPLFQALAGLERYQAVPPAVDEAARAQAGALVALYDLRYLILLPPIPGRYPYQDTWERAQDYALQVLPVEAEPFWEQDGVRAYRIQQPPIPLPFRLDLGTAGTEPYLGAGWDARLVEQPYGATATWVNGQAADLYLPLAAPTDTTLQLSLAPLAYPNAPPQTVGISVNGTAVLASQPLAEGWQTLSARVPASATRRGPNHVRLEFAWAASPRQVSADPASRGVIGGTGIVSPVNVEAHAFSEAFISVFDRQGQETKASTSRRGYNVAVIDPRSGQVLDTQGFDTAANRYETDRFVAYLAGVPAGQIVCLANKGDAAAHLTPDALRALRALGSKVQSLADLAGQSHALVGVQGAQPGTAAEALAQGDAFVAVAGDFRNLSAAVDWVELGQ